MSIPPRNDIQLIDRLSVINVQSYPATQCLIKYITDIVYCEYCYYSDESVKLLVKSSAWISGLHPILAPGKYIYRGWKPNTLDRTDLNQGKRVSKIYPISTIVLKG